MNIPIQKACQDKVEKIRKVRPENKALLSAYSASVQTFIGEHRPRYKDEVDKYANELHEEILIRKCEIIAQTNEDGTLSNSFNDVTNGCYASTFIIRRSNP